MNHGSKLFTTRLVPILLAGALLNFPMKLAVLGETASSLDAALDSIAPEFQKWAVLCVVREGKDGALAFDWHDYRGTADRKDFWPASTIKLYAEERGCTIIDAKTGNVTTPREMAECLRRVMFHERLPEVERFRISVEQLRFLREGGGGLAGLETTAPESGPSVWARGAAEVFPKARYFHKSGMISNYALDLACVDDSANGGPRYIAVPVIAAGHATKAPDGLMPAPLPPATVGETLVGRMSLEIAKWVKNSVK